MSTELIKIPACPPRIGFEARPQQLFQARVQRTSIPILGIPVVSCTRHRTNSSHNTRSELRILQPHFAMSALEQVLEPNKGDESEFWDSTESPPSANDYIFKDGKRMVRPYYFEFISHVKKRWSDKVIVDVFAQEFKGRPPEYYVRAVESGRIRIDGRRVSPSYVLRNSQRMSHFVHRHEPPVMAGPVKILLKSPDVITVCKPASVPVHPCGQYRKNTVVGILEAEHNTGKLYPIHRLDRLVSGLLILARNAETANLFRQEIEGGSVHKQYVAKVLGVFPAHEVEVNAAVIYDAREGVSSVQTGHLDAAQGKEACTRFQRLSTNGVYSIIRCEPVTGRTHQIRVHLQHLGHPIANDDLYADRHPPKRSRAGASADMAARAAHKMSSTSRSAGLVECSKNCVPSREKGLVGAELRPPETEKVVTDAIVDDVGVPSLLSSSLSKNEADDLCRRHGRGFVEELETNELSPRIERKPGGEVLLTENNQLQSFNLRDLDHDRCVEPGRLPSCRSPHQNFNRKETQDHSFAVDAMCTHCPNLGPSRYSVDDGDITVYNEGFEGDEQGLWLHCVRYSSPSWVYECPLPDWANC